MAEQLPIVAWHVIWPEWTQYHDEGDPLPSDWDDEPTEIIALTPHAPAQSALDELRREVEALRADAERYQKLRGWMSSNVSEGWQQVEQLAAIACYVDWDAFDQTLDSLPTCDVGLMKRAAIDTARASTDEGVGK